MDIAELDSREKEMRQIAKSWSIAMEASQERLRKVRQLRGDEMDAAIAEGRLVLETVCLFIHASLRCQQFRCVALPLSLCLVSFTSKLASVDVVLTRRQPPPRVLENPADGIRHHSLPFCPDGAH